MAKKIFAASCAERPSRKDRIWNVTSSPAFAWNISSEKSLKMCKSMRYVEIQSVWSIEIHFNSVLFLGKTTLHRTTQEEIFTVDSENTYKTLLKKNRNQKIKNEFYEKSSKLSKSLWRIIVITRRGLLETLKEMFYFPYTQEKNKNLCRMNNEWWWFE